MNRLVVIGFLGDKVAFLNVTREEAITRYRDMYKGEISEGVRIVEFEFNDSFAVYDIAPIEKGLGWTGDEVPLEN